MHTHMYAPCVQCMVCIIFLYTPGVVSDYLKYSNPGIDSQNLKDSSHMYTVQTLLTNTTRCFHYCSFFLSFLSGI